MILLKNAYFSIMLVSFVLSLFSLTGEAAFIAPWLFGARLTDSPSDIDSDKVLFEPVHPRTSPQSSQKSQSPSPSPSTRIYTPSPPIPIMHTEESLKDAQVLWSAIRHKYGRFCDDEDDDENASVSSTSSEFSPCPEMFAMSLGPEHAEALTKEQEERKQRKMDKKILKAKSFTLEKKGSESPRIIRQEVDDVLMEKYLEERRRQYDRKYEATADQNGSDSDSDFGKKGAGVECFSYDSF